MDLLHGNVRKIYYRYLMAAFGSAMVSSIYSIVDMAAVGQYEGASGTAALAIAAPIWNIIYSLGLLMGVGGSVLFSARRGSMTGDKKNGYCNPKQKQRDIYRRPDRGSGIGSWGLAAYPFSGKTAADLLWSQRYTHAAGAALSGTHPVCHSQFSAGPDAGCFFAQ